MTGAEWRDFLLFETRTAKIATVRANGRPHVTPVWFVLDVDDERPPFAFVIIESRAAVKELSPQDLLPWTTRIASRYVAHGQADAYGKRNAVEGELLVRVPLTKVTARSGIAD
jgi:hypothetical protein